MLNKSENDDIMEKENGNVQHFIGSDFLVVSYEFVYHYIDSLLRDWTKYMHFTV